MASKVTMSRALELVVLLALLEGVFFVAYCLWKGTLP